MKPVNLSAIEAYNVYNALMDAKAEMDEAEASTDDEMLFLCTDKVLTAIEIMEGHMQVPRTTVEEKFDE